LSTQANIIKLYFSQYFIVNIFLRDILIFSKISINARRGGGVEEQKYGQLTCSKLRGKYEYKGTKKGGGGIPIFPPIGK
jgi:hypothetical protein